MPDPHRTLRPIRAKAQTTLSWTVLSIAASAVVALLLLFGPHRGGPSAYDLWQQTGELPGWWLPCAVFGALLGLGYWWRGPL